MLSEGSEFAGTYRIVGVVGAVGTPGRNGVVYRAVGTDGEVALKIIDEPDETRREALLAAARRARTLAVPGVVMLRDVGSDGDMVWLASDFAPGKSVATLLEDGGPFEARRAVPVLVAICQALHAMHAAGLLHGDVKPGNVLVADDGTVWLTDVGVARSRGIASVAHASPEASHGYPEDERSDLYALGLVAYEMLTGSSWGEGAVGVHSEEARVVLPTDVPASVRGVVIRLLHKDRAARFRRAADVVQALTGSLPAPPRSHRGRTALASVAIAAAALGAVFFFWRRSGGDEHVRTLIMEAAHAAMVAGAASGWHSR